jgi:hypothetical protein
MLTWNSITLDEGISSETLAAATYRTVVDSFAPSIETTWSRTRINTFEINTGSVLGTFRTCNTFRSTTWWTTNVSWQAWTYSLRIHIPTLAVWPTRWWTTRINFFNNWCYTHRCRGQVHMQHTWQKQRQKLTHNHARLYTKNNRATWSSFPKYKL